MKSKNKPLILCLIASVLYTSPTLAKNWAETFEEQSYKNIDKFDQFVRKGGNKVSSSINRGLANTINPYVDKKNAQIDFENGLAYYTGNGTVQNYEFAFQAWDSAAHLGHSSAQYNLALL